MKMMRSTSITSTSGVMLISARLSNSVEVRKAIASPRLR